MRWVEAAQANSDGVQTPALQVTYTGAGGAGTSGAFPVGNLLDSAEEDVTNGNMYLDSSDLELMDDGADSQQIV